MKTSLKSENYLNSYKRYWTTCIGPFNWLVNLSGIFYWKFSFLQNISWSNICWIFVSINAILYIHTQTQMWIYAFNVFSFYLTGSYTKTSHEESKSFPMNDEWGNSCVTCTKSLYSKLHQAICNLAVRGIEVIQKCRVAMNDLKLSPTWHV